MKIEIIKNCPSCDSLLERVNDQLFCRNDYCDSRNTKQVEKYANVVRIKGLGLATINKLGLTSITDIYKLEKDNIVDIIIYYCLYVFIRN